MDRTQRLESAKQALIINAHQSDIYRHIGELFHGETLYQKAIKAFNCSLNINNQDDQTHCSLGLTLHNLGRHKEAIYHYKKAADLNPKNYTALYYIGFILIQENRVEEAIESLKSCISISKDTSPAYYLLGLALERQGQYKEARRIIDEKILENKTLFPEISFAMGELETKRRQYQCHSSHSGGLVEILLSKLNKKKLHCFGDSHRSVFNNLPFIECHNVGSGTAYNLIKVESTSGAGNQILEKIKIFNPEEDALIMAFAEIDCMEHIGKRSMLDQVDPNDLIKFLANRYCEFIDKLISKGFKVLIYGPAFSGYALNSYASQKERNYMLIKLNQKMRERCNNKKNAWFTSLDDLFINSKNILPRMNFSEDARHLDFFPSGSSEIQSIILSRFIQEMSDTYNEINNRFKTIHSLQNHCVNKPFIIVKNSKKSCLVKGILNEVNKIEIENNKDDFTSMIIDLLDHTLISQISFGINSIGNGKELNIKIFIELFSQKGIVFGSETTAKTGSKFNMIFDPKISRSIRIRFKTLEKSAFTINKLLIAGKIYIVQGLSHCDY